MAEAKQAAGPAAQRLGATAAHVERSVGRPEAQRARFRLPVFVLEHFFFFFFFLFFFSARRRLSDNRMFKSAAVAVGRRSVNVQVAASFENLLAGRIVPDLVNPIGLQARGMCHASARFIICMKQINKFSIPRPPRCIRFCDCVFVWHDHSPSIEYRAEPQADGPNVGRPRR